MESFEDLGLGPELVEALSSEGMEEPTPFQAAAIPVIRRGNNLLGRAGPGAGTLVAYGAALLDRLEAGSETPRALVVTASADSARKLAEALGGLAAATGHAVAATGSPWALPERADILFGTAPELIAWAEAARFDPNAVDALVVDQAATIQRMGGLADVEALLAFLPKEGQRVILALPALPEIEDFVERHARRAVRVPPKAVEAGAPVGPQRGEVRYRIVDEPKESGALQLVAELLDDARHVCLYFATEDGAADAGDYLTLHGYASGAPGDVSVPVWLAVRELEARASTQEGVVSLSYDAPAGPDSLDRRHGGGRGGAVLVLPREVPHLRDVAKATGFKVVPFPPPASSEGRSELDRLLARLADAGEVIDLAPYLVALEPLFARRGAAEIAAAAVALLRQRPAPVAQPSASPTPQKAASPKAAAPPRAEASRPSSRAAPPAPTAFVRLYVSLGERDDVGPGDIVGAVAGEAGIPGSQIGKIEIRDTFSIVEVQEAVAERVIRSLNGVTVRGRSVRVDYDRPRAGGRETRDPGAARAPRGGPGSSRERGERSERVERKERAGRNERGPRQERGDGERGKRGDKVERGSRTRERAAPERGAPEKRPPFRGPGKAPRDRREGPAGGGARDRTAGKPPQKGRGAPARGGARGAEDRPARGGPRGPGRGGPRKGGRPPRGEGRE